MCGIAGIVNANQVTIEKIQEMTAVIAHRGPDGDGHWINEDGRVALGHRRLAIIDLSSAGHQPMHYANKRYTITFNGEIYNYIEIRETLVKKGYTFESFSDTEVLLALYDAEKEQALNYLDGMFSFAIWDEKEKTLFAARDRFGEKPFYYAHKPGGHFAFGSEMKQLWAYGVDKAVNNEMIYRYLQFGSVLNADDTAATFFKDIYRLSAGHYLKLSLADVKTEIKKYWQINPDTINDSITEKQAAENFSELFYTSLKRRLRSDVPVGSSLSGGLDSSLVVCAIDELNKGQQIKQNTFSARFPGFYKDEGKYMQYVIDKTNVVPHFTYPDESKFFDILDKVMWHQEEPFGSASIYVQYEVMKLAKENNVTVLLDGQGADEILAGYHPYYQIYFNELYHRNKRRYRDEVIAYKELQGNNQINAKVSTSYWTQLMKELLPGKVKNQIALKMAGRKYKQFPFLNSDFYHQYRYVDKEFIESSMDGRSNLQEALLRSATGIGLQELLRYADRNSMAHSREVRLPFLCHELVEYLFTLPSHLKINQGWTKYIMRKAFDHLLPAEIAWRKDKIGYEPPQESWMNNRKNQEKVIWAQEKMAGKGILNKQLLNGANRLANRESLSWKMLMLATMEN